MREMNMVPIGFGIVLVITMVEIVLSARCNRSYFTVGLPIFWRRIDRIVGLEGLSLDDLQKSAATVAFKLSVIRSFCIRSA